MSADGLFGNAQESCGLLDAVTGSEAFEDCGLLGGETIQG